MLLVCTCTCIYFEGKGIEDNLIASESVGGILMLVLQHCTDPKLHSMIIETLLPLKENLYKDLFMIMAYGPPNTRIPAVKLLFHYWPQLQVGSATK